MELGKYNTLKVVKDLPQGLYLADAEANEVLLIGKDIPEGTSVGDELEVFIYQDNENRLIATTKTPNVVLDEFAVLKVKDVNGHGAFLDWGLEKDLFVPYAEQRSRMEEGRYYIVILFYDEESDRLAASSKYGDFTVDGDIDLKYNQEVEILIADRTDLGYNVIIDSEFVGLLYNSDIFKKVRYGEYHKGFIKNIREDGKIDVTLQKQGYKNVEASLQKILDKLERNNGYLNMNDKSDPEIVYEVFGMSKKTFKKALGSLYKQRLIEIKKDGIHTVK